MDSRRTTRKRKTLANPFLRMDPDLSLRLYDYVMHASIAILLVLVLAFGAGCVRNSAQVTGTSGEESAKKPIGSERGTWNRTPQGGSDEKSNSAPIEPAESVPAART